MALKVFQIYINNFVEKVILEISLSLKPKKLFAIL